MTAHAVRPAAHRARAFATTATALALLAACGSTGSRSSASSAAAGKGPARIRIAGPAANATAMAAGGAPAAEDSSAKVVAPGAASNLMMPFRPVTYVLAANQSALEEDAPAWRYPANGTVTAATATTLARALGLEAQAVVVPADEGGGFRFGPDDGSGPVLHVSTDSLGSWWYSGAAGASSGYACAGAAVAVGPVPTDDAVPQDPPTTLPVPDCAPPAPPEGVPTETEARTAAAALAKAVGRDVAADDIVVSGDAYGRYAVLYERLDGVRSPLAMSANWGAKGELQFANGQLATPERADRYPRIGTAAAVDALNAGDAGWFGGPVPMMAVDRAAADATLGGAAGATAGAIAGGAAPSGVVAIAPGEPVPGCTDTVTTVEPPTEPATSADPLVAPGVATAAAPCGPVDLIPLTDDSVPEVTIEPPVVDTTPIVATITEVRASFVQLYGVDGEVWLLPGYEFVTADNGSMVVPAVDKSYVEIVQPSAPVGDPVAKPVPVPQTAAAVPPPAAVKPVPAPTTVLPPTTRP